MHQSRLISLKAGDLDIITTVDYPDFKLLQNDSAFNTQSSSGPRTDVVYLNHNNEFLKQKIIRKAISLAINRNEIAQLTGSEAASGVISPHFDFGREITPTDYNPSLAASLLDTAKIIDLNHDGIREFNGQNIELNYRLKSDHGSADSLIIAQCIKEDLAAQGIKVNLIQTENLSAAISASDFDLCSANDSALPTGDSGYFLKSRYHSKGDANFGHYANQDLDALLSTKDFTSGFTPQIGNNYIACIAIDGFPQCSYLGILNSLALLPFPYRFHSRFLAFDKMQSHILLEKLPQTVESKVTRNSLANF